MVKFKLGETISTQRIVNRMKLDKDFAKFIWESFCKYINGDWGDTCKEDSQSNNEAALNNERILAVYNYHNKQLGCDEPIWIITEWDRSVTTILFPDEY